MAEYFGQPLLQPADSARVADALVAWIGGMSRHCSLPPVEAEKKTPVQGSGLEHRMIQALLAEQIEFVEDAQALPDACILKMPNIGRTSLARLKAWKRAAP